MTTSNYFTKSDFYYYRFISNTAPKGGAIYIQNAIFYMNNSFFINNTINFGQGNGEAIYYEGGVSPNYFSGNIKKLKIDFLHWNNKVIAFFKILYLQVQVKII